MKARVYLLRTNGRRIRPDLRKPIHGFIQLQATLRGKIGSTALHLLVRDPRGSRSDELAPPLFEPVLIALGTDALLVQGFESIGGAAFVQEWRCVLEPR